MTCTWVQSETPAVDGQPHVLLEVEGALKDAHSRNPGSGASRFGNVAATTGSPFMRHGLGISIYAVDLQTPILGR